MAIEIIAREFNILFIRIAICSTEIQLQMQTIRTKNRENVIIFDVLVWPSINMLLKMEMGTWCWGSSFANVIVVKYDLFMLLKCDRRLKPFWHCFSIEMKILLHLLGLIPAVCLCPCFRSFIRSFVRLFFVSLFRCYTIEHVAMRHIHGWLLCVCVCVNN